MVDDCQKAPSPLLPEKNEIIWGSLAFLVLLVAMWKWGVPAVKNMERAREERIRNDLEAAERAHSEADAEKTQYERQIADSRNEAGRIIEEARQSAEVVRADLIARAEQEAREIRERAQGDIANQRAQALAQLRDEVAQLSIDLASRIVERNLDNETNRQLVESFLEQTARSN
jgi:F-type H+-transporting ATPase subunit b